MSLLLLARDVIKICCVNCGKEYILFDNNEHGYDGVVGYMEASERADRSMIEYKKVCDTAECKVEIRNTCPYGDFEEEFGESGSYEMYTNAFSDITIIAFTSKEKKTIFSAETQ